MSEPENQQSLPLVPVKGTVLFPGVVLPLSVGRPASVAAVEAALATEGKEIVVFAQLDPEIDQPEQEHLYSIGVKAVIKKMSRPNKDLIELIVQGIQRCVLIKMESIEPHFIGRIRPAPVEISRGPEVEALHRAVLELAGQVLSLARPQSSIDLTQLVGEVDEPLKLVYLLGSMLSLDLKKEQALLEAHTDIEALRLMHTYLSYELQVLQLRYKIASEAQSEITREQRDYLLRQQLRAIQEELGEENPEQAELKLLRGQLQKADLPDDIRKQAERELSRLERLPAISPEHNVLRTYIDLVLELPWKKSSEVILDIPRARQVLDEDHYDLTEVKKRILEHLAVMKLNPEARSPILCFVGPPGVGKTSLGQSIARAMNRKFERMSLGGMHDEAELRGHRRTYIGAMPGRIIQAIRRAGVNNPVMMLDEVDKLGRDFRGDPAAALLEILDPEQNWNFRDNYLDLPFDLSTVFFIGTANALEPIPKALLDRMETLRLSGYSEEEKIQIAHRYLIPRQVKEAGLTSDNFKIADDALSRVIRHYTREAGLRQLERAIGQLARKIALRQAEGDTQPVTISAGDLSELLGPEKIFQEEARKEVAPGVAVGLAWTETGGEVLYVEAALLPDGKGLMLTGQLGEIMQESAKAAQTYIWSHADEFGIDRDRFKNFGVHIHVPAGAIPKDGPSAGTTMVAALASLYTGLPASKDTAMTGEITLSGLVMPVGGIKEKILAAKRAGISRVILPKANEKDLPELPEHVRKEMEFVLVERVDELLAAAIPGLTPQPA